MPLCRKKMPWLHKILSGIVSVRSVLCAVPVPPYLCKEKGVLLRTRRPLCAVYPCRRDGAGRLSAGCPSVMAPPPAACRVSSLTSPRDVPLCGVTASAEVFLSPSGAALPPGSPEFNISGFREVFKMLIQGFFFVPFPPLCLFAYFCLCGTRP